MNLLFILIYHLVDSKDNYHNEELLENNSSIFSSTKIYQK